MPLAAARPFARPPEAMALISILIGAVSVLGGLQGALMLDTPTIVCIAAILFLLVNIGNSLRSVAGQGGGK